MTKAELMEMLKDMNDNDELVVLVDNGNDYMDEMKEVTIKRIVTKAAYEDEADKDTLAKIDYLEKEVAKAEKIIEEEAKKNTKIAAKRIREWEDYIVLVKAGLERMKKER